VPSASASSRASSIDECLQPGACLRSTGNRGKSSAGLYRPALNSRCRSASRLFATSF
jgi:hypothetical protein